MAFIMYVEAENQIPVRDDPRAPDDDRDLVELTIMLGTITMPEILGVVKGWAASVNALPPEARRTVARITLE